METSDSEYFESADEDFQSDEEDTKTIKDVRSSEKNSDPECINEAVKTLKNVKLTENQVQDTVNDNKTNNNSRGENLEKDGENNVSRSEIRKQDISKEPIKKLGIKLGKNLDNVKKQTPSEMNIKTEETNLNLIESKDDLPTAPDDKKCEENLSKSTNQEDKSEENLWEDSEVDWGMKKDEDNMWDNDDWEPIEESKPQEKVPPVNTSWGSWGSWDVSSIISTATQSVSTITQGITTAIETGMGVPEPEELAKINRAEKVKLKEGSPDVDDTEKHAGFGLGNFVMGVSHLTKLVESTGTKVISGGLDTLETIGKKTMEVLQEGDPGLKKKRAFLKIDQDKPVLSQLLREAKEKAENENKILEQKHFAKKAKNYETLFDDHQGLVHLEALEMLSKQCDIKLQSLLESYTDESLTDMQETMEQVKELCELPDEDEDEQVNWSEIKEKLNGAVTEINIPISYKKLIDAWEETEVWLNNLKLEICDERELHQQAVETLAQLTAIAVEQFHKSGELLLVKEHRSTADEADSLVQLTTSLTALIGVVAAKFSDKLNAKSSNSKNKEEINELITNVFFEAANSSSYIQDAFQLLIPVLQVGAV